MKKIFNILVFVAIAIFLGNSCQKPEFESATSFDQLIGEYLEEDSTFSEFSKILSLTGNISFLKAYGAYTCFVPTNDAIAKYLEKKQISKIEEISVEELDELIQYHVILDTLSTTEFFDGKLKTPNMYGQYLLVSVIVEEGRSKSVINKYSQILQADNRYSNGIVHIIESVLEPITESIAQLLEKEEQYSVFTKALKETGYFNLLNTVSDKEDKDKLWFTVFAQTNQSLESSGITSYDELKAKYCNTGIPSSPFDSLNLYMAYHILGNSLLYMGDLVQTQAQVTLAPSEVITIKLNKDSLMLNEEFFDEKLEKGIFIIRDESDRTSANGVFHTLESNLSIKVRYPFAVYFDVCDQPELKKMVGIFRSPGGEVTLTNGQLAGVTWHSDNTIRYKTDNGGTLAPGSLIHEDYLDVILRTAVIRWIEFKTPVIVKGKYKVWICTRNVTTRRASFIVSFNGDPMPNVINNTMTLPSNPMPSDAELLAMGFKRYNYNVLDSATYYTDKSRVVGQLAGTIEVPTTGNHTVRFDAINSEMNGMWIDMIQFIPDTQDQIWPRLTGTGELVYGYPEGYQVIQ